MGKSCGRPETSKHFLRSLKWRLDLGSLECPPISSIEDLRHAIANSRRRYAHLRRDHLIDLHFQKDENRGPDLIVDDPLSQNPDSMWGRFFRNVELEKMVDQDLSRLYPEHEGYFKTGACQDLLRRVLLLWCLGHPDCGYKQGMHELLAPLLCVLHTDVQHASQVRKIFADVYADKFDRMIAHESNQSFSTSGSPVSSKWGTKNVDDFQEDKIKPLRGLDDLEPEVRTIVLLTDPYGPEGELGIASSERFMEHDAYCMFDALMTGAGGVVAMSDFFLPSPVAGTLTGLPVIIEASSSLYHFLSAVDTPLYGHLVELGIEPQYFSLRWFRLLFGREFSMVDLFLVWDEIFSSSNCRIKNCGNCDAGWENAVRRVLMSYRGIFIIALAVSMLLHLRASLLASENATSCLQRLLKFPENVDLRVLIEKARSLHTFALESSLFSSPSSTTFAGSKQPHCRSSGVLSGSCSPSSPLNLLPGSYWEEKWSLLHSADKVHVSSSSEKISRQRFFEQDKFRPVIRAFATSASKHYRKSQSSQSSVRRRLLDDLSKDPVEEEHKGKGSNNGKISISQAPEVTEEEKNSMDENYSLNGNIEELSSSGLDTSEEQSVSSLPSHCSRFDGADDMSETSHASNSCVSDTEDTGNSIGDMCSSPAKVHHEIIEESTDSTGSNKKSKIKSSVNGKDNGQVSSKFHWLWRFTRNAETSSRAITQTQCTKKFSPVDDMSSSRLKLVPNAKGVDGHGLQSACDVFYTDMAILHNLGNSMLKNIQVIESVQGDSEIRVRAALKELRRISTVLSEM